MKDFEIEMNLTIHTPGMCNVGWIYATPEAIGKRLLVCITAPETEENEHLRDIPEIERGIPVYDEVIFETVTDFAVSPRDLARLEPEDAYEIHAFLISEDDEPLKLDFNSRVDLERDKYRVVYRQRYEQTRAIRRLTSVLKGLSFDLGGDLDINVLTTFIGGRVFNLSIKEGFLRYHIEGYDDQQPVSGVVQNIDTFLEELSTNELLIEVFEGGLLYERFLRPVWICEETLRINLEVRAELLARYVHQVQMAEEIRPVSFTLELTEDVELKPFTIQAYLEWSESIDMNSYRITATRGDVQWLTALNQHFDRTLKEWLKGYDVPSVFRDCTYALEQITDGDDKQPEFAGNQALKELLAYAK